MAAMAMVLQIAAGIASLVCFMVLMAMFQHGQTGLGIACIVLIFCGVGGLIAFIYGWVKSSEWNIKNLMLLWTGAIVIAILGTGLSFALNPQVMAVGP